MPLFWLVSIYIIMVVMFMLVDMYFYKELELYSIFTGNYFEMMYDNYMW